MDLPALRSRLRPVNTVLPLRADARADNHIRDMTKLTAADRATLAILTPTDLAQLEHIRLRRGSGVSAYLDGYRAGLRRVQPVGGSVNNIWNGVIRFD